MLNLRNSDDTETLWVLLSGLSVIQTTQTSLESVLGPQDHEWILNLVPSLRPSTSTRVHPVPPRGLSSFGRVLGTLYDRYFPVLVFLRRRSLKLSFGILLPLFLGPPTGSEVPLPERSSQPLSPTGGVTARKVVGTQSERVTKESIGCRSDSSLGRPRLKFLIGLR